MRVYVGTYTGGESEGIYACNYDRESGRLGVIHATRSENPSFLALHPSGRALYAVNENESGELSAYAVDRGSGALRHTATVATHGSSPCHLSVHPSGDALYAANYGSGSVTTHLVGADLRPQEALQVIRHEGSGPDLKRQKGPHAHSINVDPQGTFAYAPDLGIDRVMIYRIASDRRLEPASQPWAQLAAGSGPRHFAFHPLGGIAYVINELASTIVAFRRNERTGALEELESAASLPESFRGESSCADIHLDPLVFPVSVDPNNGLLILETVAELRGRYGNEIHFAPGLSNISYGMPNRKLINQVFTHLCTKRGLDGGIVDPLQINGGLLEALDTSSEAYALTRAFLMGEDQFGMGYIKAVREGRI